MTDFIKAYFKSGDPVVVNIGTPLTLDLNYDSSSARSEGFTKDGRVATHVEIETSQTVEELLPRIQLTSINKAFELDVVDVNTVSTVSIGARATVDTGSVERRKMTNLVTLLFEPPGPNTTATWKLDDKTPVLSLTVHVKRI